MKAMIFAAGRGERMRPLTDTIPKPLVQVRGRPLITWHVLNLVRAGITDIVINHSRLGHMIEDELGDGSRYGARIAYSHEPEPLETAGGIVNARHLLGEEPFLAISADIYAPYFDYSQALDVLKDQDALGKPYPADKRDIAWLYLTPNPFHNPQGDFGLNLFTLTNDGDPKWNFANIGVYRPEMFDGLQPGEFVKLGPLLRKFIGQGRVGGEIYTGPWVNVGTVQQLEELNAPYANTSANTNANAAPKAKP